MKKPLLLVAALLCAAPATFAQSAPSEAETKKKIEQTLRYYLDGGTNRDQATVTKAFQPEASMLFVRDGAFTVMPIKDYLANIKPGPKIERTTRIVSITVVGNAAQAQVESEGADYRMTDFMNLLEIGGEWRIVNKIFTRQPKPVATAGK
jgi:protease I